MVTKMWVSVQGYEFDQGGKEEGWSVLVYQGCSILVGNSKKMMTVEMLKDFIWMQFKEIFRQQFVPSTRKYKYQRELYQLEQWVLSLFENL